MSQQQLESPTLWDWAERLRESTALPEREARKKIMQLVKTSHPNLEMWLRDVITTYQEKDKDCFVLILGNKGVGKSTLALRILKTFNMLTDKAYYLKRSIIFTKDSREIKNIFAHADDKEMKIFDEGARFLLSEDWAGQDNRRLKKIFAEIRTKHLLIVACFPFKYKWVQSKYRDSLFEYVILLLDRDKGIIFQKNNNPAAESFDIDNVFEKMKFIPVELDEKMWRNIRMACKRSPDYYCSFSWGKVSSSLYKKYLKLRDAAIWKETLERGKEPPKSQVDNTAFL